MTANVWPIEELTGMPNARMAWSIRLYAKLVVVGCRHKLINWPANIPFLSPSDIRGGISPIQLLYDLWQSGTLRFEPATDDDVNAARTDANRVHPNPALISEQPPPRTAVVVAPRVLHPSSLVDMGEHPTSTHSGAVTAVLGKRPRNQRKDMNKARPRPVTNPEGRPLRHPKPGLLSKRSVLDWEESEASLDGKDGGTGDGARAEKRARFQFVFWTGDDPVGEFR